MSLENLHCVLGLIDEDLVFALFDLHSQERMKLEVLHPKTREDVFANSRKLFVSHLVCADDVVNVAEEEDVVVVVEARVVLRLFESQSNQFCVQSLVPKFASTSQTVQGALEFEKSVLFTPGGGRKNTS